MSIRWMTAWLAVLLVGGLFGCQETMVSERTSYGGTRPSMTRQGVESSSSDSYAQFRQYRRSRAQSDPNTGPLEHIGLFFEGIGDALFPPAPPRSVSAGSSTGSPRTTTGGTAP